MKYVFSILLLLFDLVAQDFSGHIKNTSSINDYDSQALNSQFGPDRTISDYTNIRLMYEQKNTGFFWGVHNVLESFAGDGLQAYRQSATALFPPAQGVLLTDDRMRMFDLNKVLADDENYLLNHRLDRLFAAYQSNDFSISLGRQIVSWGNGLVFQTLDPFNPFQPNNTDKDYKTGDDMLKMSYSFNDKTSLEAVAIGRRDLQTDNISDDASSFAIKLHKNTLDILDLDFVLAQHYGDPMLGTGVSLPVFEGILRSDFSLLNLSESGQYSYLLNYDRALTFLNDNLYFYAEYYHNSLGNSSGNYQSISDPLKQRLIRGELFTLAKNYWSPGMRWEATALLNIYTNLIINIDDDSAIYQLRGNYNLSDSLDLILGLNVPLGSKGTEFGGIVLPNNANLEPAKEVYLRIAYYF